MFKELFLKPNFHGSLPRAVDERFDVNFFKVLPRILIILVIGASFLVFFNDQKRQGSSRISSLEKVVNLEPSDFNKRLQLALLYEREFNETGNLQNLERALEEAQAARQLEPGNLSAAKLLLLLNRANASETIKEIQNVRNIVEARPDYAAAWLKLAMLYEKLGDEASAAEAGNRAKLLNGNF